jgi:hypothetical protein
MYYYRQQAMMHQLQSIRFVLKLIIYGSDFRNSNVNNRASIIQAEARR